MSANALAISIRAKKLGVLIYDARISSRHSIKECADAIGVTEEMFQAYEAGTKSPTLPEIELLAYYLEIPLSHFWSRQSISESSTSRAVPHAARLIQLRQRMIGALIRQVRTNSNLSARDITDRVGISEADLRAVELGERALSLPELDLLVSALGGHIDFFMDQKGPVGEWRAQQKAIQEFLELSPEIQQFVSKPLNRPYLELAMRLSDLSVEKLRNVAEGLLEITY